MIFQMGIRQLVEFVYREGSLSSTFSPSSSAQEGTRLHQLVQRRQGPDYQSEFYLSHVHPLDDNITLILSGRADGILRNDDYILIDEIKSTALELDEIEFKEIHLAQVKFYGYIYMLQNHLQEVMLRLTYIQIESEATRYFEDTYTFDQLEAFFNATIESYVAFLYIQHQLTQLRNFSIKGLRFPFDAFRPGQEDMMRQVYHHIQEGGPLFIQAATGIGKTMSTLYPAILSLGKGSTSKIMYLTAKNVTRQVALDALTTLVKNGLRIRFVEITAKEKICFQEECRCNPETCPFANGHYDRINGALYDMLCHENQWTKDVISEYAKKHQVCPFEYSLDLYNYCDVSVSDYNYAFDPRVRLARAFDEKNDYTLLVDEAHNLVDRARSMYSVEINALEVEALRQSFKPKKGALYRSVKKIAEHLNNSYEEQETKHLFPYELFELLEKFSNICRKVLPTAPESPFKDEVMQLFFTAASFRRIEPYFNSDYITYFEDHVLHVSCLNPRHCLMPIYKEIGSAILFSATLLPIRYFYDLLGGEDTKKLYYPSPFPKQHFMVLAASDIDATYRRREYYHERIVQYLKQLTTTKAGHYLVFFPSYRYLNDVAAICHLDDVEVFVQNQEMTLEQRDAFLNAFKEEPEENKLFMCVLGGNFSEGIDLKEDQVIGVVVVSVGYPQISFERNLIKEHFDEENQGENYAYVYPGFNKVLQGAGRLIRTMKDTGVILLLDERYSTRRYLSLYPREWQHAKRTNIDVVRQQLTTFWSNVDKDEF